MPRFDYLVIEFYNFMKKVMKKWSNFTSIFKNDVFWAKFQWKSASKIASSGCKNPKFVFFHAKMTKIDVFVIIFHSKMKFREFEINIAIQIWDQNAQKWSIFTHFQWKTVIFTCIFDDFSSHHIWDQSDVNSKTQKYTNRSFKTCRSHSKTWKSDDFYTFLKHFFKK